MKLTDEKIEQIVEAVRKEVMDEFDGSVGHAYLHAEEIVLRYKGKYPEINENTVAKILNIAFPSG